MTVSKWKVTFKFRHAPVTVEVVADSELDAVAKARCLEVGTPVPECIAATAVEILHGGRRDGTGNRAGVVLVAEPRIVCKTMRWTKREWNSIKKSALGAGLSATDWQRQKILA